MRSEKNRRFVRIHLLPYGVAIVSVGLGLGLTQLLLPWLSPNITSLFFMAVMVSAWYGGWRAGLLSTILATLSINYFFNEPLYSLKVINPRAIVQLVAFLATAGVISSLNHSRRSALRKVRVTLQSLQEAMEQVQWAGAVSNAAEAAATMAKEQLESVLSSINDGFYVLDRNWCFTYVNDRFCEIATIPRSTILGRNVWELFPSTVNTEADVQFHRAVQEQTPLQFDYFYSPFSRWYDHRIYPTPTGLTVFLADITDRKQTDLLLVEQKRLLELVAVGCPLDECLSAICGSIFQLNPSIQACFLLTDAQRRTFPRSITPSFPPSFGQGLKDAPINDLCIGTCGEAAYCGEAVTCANIAQDDRWSREWRDLCIAHQVLACHSVPVMGIDNQPLGSLMLCFNEPRMPTDWEHQLAQFGVQIASIVFERDRSCLALQKSEEQLLLASKSGNFGLWRWDIESDTLTWTEQAKVIFGLPTDTVMSIPVFLAAVHPDDRAFIQTVITDLKANQPHTELEYRTLWADGTVRWILAKSDCTYNDDGALVSTQGVLIDISDRVQFEEDRERLLHQEQVAREAAESANRIKDEFLAVLSHELRSPLNPILGWTRLLQSGKLDKPKTEQALDTIERNAKLQTELIADLLDVSRILQGKLSLNVRSVDLATIVEAAIETVRLAAEAKEIEIKTEIGTDLGRVSGDPSRLQQIVWNLASNAVKFTPPGGQVVVRLTCVDHQAQISVRDTGKGINLEFLPHVFDYFRQEDGGTTRKFGGLGLGLAIVRHLVELHGGTVQADSLGEGQGATFTVKLPLITSGKKRDDSVSSLPSLAHTDQALSGMRILVVDDEPDMRDLISFLLKQAGANVVTVAIAQEALTALSEFLPNVLLSDIGMPEMDGYMLLRQVRLLPSEQGGKVPAIALTAYAGELDQKQALAAGFQRHLAKPIDPEVLVKEIAQLCDRNGGARS